MITFNLSGDDAKKQREVLLGLAGNWAGGGESVSISASNEEFPSKDEQKTQGKLIFNDKVVFRRMNFKRIIPEKDDLLYDSFILTFWLDFKQRYRSITFDSKGFVYHKDFTVNEEGDCQIYSKIDGKFILIGKSKVTKDKFEGSSEYEYGGYIRKSNWKFLRTDKVTFKDPVVEIEPDIKKVLDTFPGKFPLPGHFKLLEEKEMISVFGYSVKEKAFMKWEIHADGNYKVFEGKGFLDSTQAYWKQIE